MANGLTWLLLAATGSLLLIFVAIGIDPAIPFNPYPPPTASPPPPPSATPSPPRQDTATATPARPRFTTPTPLRPATPLATPNPTMPFSVTVERGAGPDCSPPLLAGTVTDREGEPLVGYPIHIWGPGVDTIVLSGSAPGYGPSGWETVVSARGGETWSVQLHLPNPRRAYPPLSAIVEVTLPPTCPQAILHFRQRR